jgi:hypothetical protein
MSAKFFNVANYTTWLGATFGNDILKFHRNPNDPSKIDIVMQRATERLIILFKYGKFFRECDRNVNILSLK